MAGKDLFHGINPTRGWDMKPPDSSYKIPLNGGSVASRTSFSGVDYKIQFFLPKTTLWQQKWQTRELLDEVNELDYRAQQLEAVISSTAPVLTTTLLTGGGISTEFRATELARVMEELAAVNEAATKVRQQLANVNGLKGEHTIVVLDSLQTFSYQVHRGKKPVRSLGAVYPKAYTDGARAIAGSMIFTVFNEHPLVPLIDSINSLYPDLGRGGRIARITRGSSNKDSFIPSTALIDELPPLDILITAVDEMGSASYFTLYGMRFLSEGQVASVQNTITELTVNFVAQDFDPMRTMDTRGSHKIKAIDRKVTVSELLRSKESMARRIRRHYPF